MRGHCEGELQEIENMWPCDNGSRPEEMPIALRYVLACWEDIGQDKLVEKSAQLVSGWFAGGGDVTDVSL